ncbi:uncharacterized protein MYCGRDRAFT_93853 [Zymoseptoria tritici IPO323]|uniref:Uncharacterized protein n=1 Tax=Zymoseptoria tritici (strain CBS 115943 / IPO323) TaxID=336722 RepID=F9XD89_ZYMTI|nr:uncharacterized protein MYCGRDRAFT_93853 [Zymoseptoria tritici IPO323]EGP86446.1 hypothetical protein MYCGRDRAFT_93853 [Zymoseptoria tritici IPO323]
MPGDEGTPLPPPLSARALNSAQLKHNIRASLKVRSYAAEAAKDCTTEQAAVFNTDKAKVSALDTENKFLGGRNYKTDVFIRGRKHVEKLLEEHEELATIDELASAKFFAENFSAKAFFSVFCRYMYSEICSEILDSIKANKAYKAIKPNKKMDKNARDELIAAYDGIPVNEA